MWSQVSCYSLCWLCVIPSFPWIMDPPWCGCAFSQINHCWLLGWIPVIQGISYCFLWWFFLISYVSLPLTRVAPHHSSFPTFIHWCCFASSYMYYCHLLWWLSIISGFSHLVTDVGPCNPQYSTTSHWGGSVSFQVFHWFLLGWLYEF